MFDLNDLNALRVGDEVVVVDDRQYLLRKINRVTKTQISVPVNDERNWKFNKKNGRLIGSSYSQYRVPFLAEATPRLRAIIKNKHLQYKIDKLLHTINVAVKGKAVGSEDSLEELEKIHLALIGLLGSIKS